jgi:hypothetical protein
MSGLLVLYVLFFYMHTRYYIFSDKILFSLYQSKGRIYKHLNQSIDDLQNINKLASALLLFIKVPNLISHKKYIEKVRWNLNLSATMQRQVCLHFANRPFNTTTKLVLECY